MAVIRAVIERGQATYAVARQLKVPYTTAVQWVTSYKERGEAAFLAQPTAPRVRKPKSFAAEARSTAILATQRAQPQAGSRRIRDVMRRFLGIGTSETTVRRVLREAGVKAQKPPRRVRREEAVRHFERAQPNQLWQSDLFTFLLRRHERIYVAAFLDDHSRYLVSLVMAHHQRSVLVLEALSRAIAQYGAPKEILTDQGRQYTAWRGSTEFEAELKRHGIKHIKSRPHHPQTCGKIERFWKTLWEELLSRTVFADFEDCQRRVALFIQHYNFQRPHQGLEGHTPADRFFRASDAVRTAIEAQVSDNALRLAREQPARKPFYLAGQLGEKELAISASHAALSVRVGDEHTTIAFTPETEDEPIRVSRWDAGRQSGEAPAPHALSSVPTPVSEEPSGASGDGARSLPDDARGALGPEDRHPGDRGGEDLPRPVLPARAAGVEGDDARARSAARRGEERVAGASPGATTGEDLECAAAIPDATQKERGAVAADGDEVEPHAPQLGARPATGLAIEEDDAWRRLALIWERKLCGAQESGHERGAHEGEALDLHASPGSPTGALAEDGGDHPGDRRLEDGERGGTGGKPLAQSLPDSHARDLDGDDRNDIPQGGGPTRKTAGDERSGTTPQEARTGERATQKTRGGHR